MIAFDMQCSSGHIFEGWFDSLKSFDEQNSKDMVSCPYCEDKNIKKVLSPVSVKRSAESKLLTQAPIDYHKLAKEMINYINTNSEDVGTKFAAEALKMHYGATEKKNIRGIATPQEEESLKQEGVDFFKFPAYDPEKDKNN